MYQIDPEVVRYISENRGRYTRDAITRALVRAGYDAAEVEAAWESVDPHVERGLPHRRQFWLPFILSVVAMYGMAALGYLLWTSSIGFDVDYFSMRVLLTVLSIGAVLSILQVRLNRARAAGAASGILAALLIPFVVLVIISGICVVVTQMLSNSPYAMDSTLHAALCKPCPTRHTGGVVASVQDVLPERNA